MPSVRVSFGMPGRTRARAARAWVIAACAAALCLGAACQRKTGPAPLRENVQVGAFIAQQRADAAFRATAIRLSPKAVAALEATVRNGWQGLDTVKRLRVYYEATAPSLLPWNELIAKRLPHLLWLIEHHPEDPAAIWRVSRAADPAGYARAADAWIARTGRPDVTPVILKNAAGFFTGEDDPRAEALLVRARGLDPDGRRSWPPSGFGDQAPSWSRYMGQFYGGVFIGPRNPQTGRPSTTLDGSPFVVDVRRRVLASDDSVLVAGAAARLLQTGDPERQTLGRQLLDRALQLDPAGVEARQLAVSLVRRERQAVLRQAVRDRQIALAGGEIARKLSAGEALTPQEQADFGAREYEAVVQLPEADRLGALASLAAEAYLRAENLQYGANNAAGATASLAVSKRAADDALGLAATLGSRPDAGDVVYRAHVVLALHALRGGGRAAATQHMRQAAAAPISPPESSADEHHLATRLANYLLRAGERESVVDFLEKSAARGSSMSETFKREAAAVRAGDMPASYQFMAAR